MCAAPPGKTVDVDSAWHMFRLAVRLQRTLLVSIARHVLAMELDSPGLSSPIEMKFAWVSSPAVFLSVVKCRSSATGCARVFNRVLDALPALEFAS